MRARDVLRVWDAGRDRHPIDRALLLLEAAAPGVSRAELADLTIGERDARLFAIREQLLGDALDCFVRCPECGESLEFELSVSQLLVAESADRPEPSLEWAGQSIQLRAFDSHDLARVVGAEEVEARALLVRACIVGGEVDGFLDDEDFVATLAARLAELDPQADLHIELACAECGTGWRTQFDIGSFLWAELDTLARRLIREVAVLARSYGWREADIVGMSAERRAQYLELAQ